MEQTCYDGLITSGNCKAFGPPSANSPESISSSSNHIFKDLTFWHHFQRQILLKAWKCNFTAELLQDTWQSDARLYENDNPVFTERRERSIRWVSNDTEWTTLVLGACKELAEGHKGRYCEELEFAHVFDAFKDFVDHVDYFYRVAHKMRRMGHPVVVFSQEYSEVHDIDKLDPVMLVGYSERFEDNVSSSLWNTCLDRHVHVNPHHQVHCVWHQDCIAEECTFCGEERSQALVEMVCDKVSRRVQKNLGGRMIPEMWDVEQEFFNGLPDAWLVRAVDLMCELKQQHEMEENI